MDFQPERLERSLYQAAQATCGEREAALMSDVREGLTFIQSTLKDGSCVQILEVVYRDSPEMYGNKGDEKVDPYDKRFFKGNYKVILGKHGITRIVVRNVAADFDDVDIEKPISIEEYLDRHLNDFSLTAESPENLANSILACTKSKSEKPYTVVLNYWDPEETK